MGSAQGDYHQQIGQALQQANLPKSPFSQQFTGSMSQSYLPALAGMLNAGSLGNAFPGFNAGSNTPGSISNQNQVPNSGINNTQAPPSIPAYNPSTANPNQPANVNPIPQGGYHLPNTGYNANGLYQGMVNPANSVSAVPNQPQLADPNSFNPNGNFGFDAATGLVTQGNQQIGIQDYLNRMVQTGMARSLPEAQLMALGSNTTGMQSVDANGNPTYAPGAQPFNLDQYLANARSQAPAANSNFTPGNSGSNGGGVDPNAGYNNNDPSQTLDPNAAARFLQNGMLTNGQGNILQNYNLGMGNGYNQQGNYSNGQQGQFPDFSSLIQQANPNLAGLLNPSLGLMNSPNFNQQYSGMNGIGNIPGLANALQNGMGLTGMLGGSGQANINPVNQPNANLQAAAPSNVSAPNTQLQLGLPNIQDDQYYQGVQQALNNQLTQGRDDIRARFGAGGGASRGTPAAFAESQYDAQALPQLASALGGVRQQEVGNQLQAANQGNSALLQARGQDIGNSQQNVQNYLQSIGLNNDSSLQARGQNINLGLGNNSNTLQNQSLGNNYLLGAQGNSLQGLNNLSNLFLGNQGQGLQNYFNTIGANQAGNSQLGQLAGQAGQQSLGNTNLLSQLSQFNSGQNNQANQNYMGMLTGANQQQIQNQFQGLQNVLQIAAQLGLSGIPGGSANVNLGSQSQSALQQIGGLL